MASVAYESVSKRYIPDGLAAVNNLSLDIADQEFMVLVGPSGCGKTTALRMLAGLEEVTEGTIKIGDRVVNQVPVQERDISMVFQSYALYPHMSVFENIGFGLKMRGMDKADIETRVKEAGKMLGLQDLLHRKPRELSGGQRQRVALGRSIVRNPQVFLLDEPLSNLDAALRGETRINLQKLHRQLGATFVYVTHDQVEAMTMGDRIAVMKDGKLQQCSSPSELYDNPANAYVAGFIGTPKMNFIPVTISDRAATASAFKLDLPKAPGIEKGLLGIRPEHLNEHPTDGSPQIEIVVDVVEMLGSEQVVYGRAGGDELKARIDPHFRVLPGDRMMLGVDTRRLHLFDLATELTVL
jgi:multiple sugar transport system ATP-binding protein